MKTRSNNVHDSRRVERVFWGTEHIVGETGVSGGAERRVHDGPRVFRWGFTFIMRACKPPRSFLFLKVMENNW